MLMTAFGLNRKAVKNIPNENTAVEIFQHSNKTVGIFLDKI